jgi:hypothetical protein
MAMPDCTKKREYIGGDFRRRILGEINLLADGFRARQGNRVRG